jgi:hypothetical protein
MDISKYWMKNITSNNFKLDTYWKKEKRETEINMERSVFRAMEEYGLRDGDWRTDFVGDWVSKDFTILFRTITYSKNVFLYLFKYLNMKAHAIMGL